MTERSKSLIKSGLAALLLFLAGAVSGGAYIGHRLHKRLQFLASSSPEERAADSLKRLSRRLHLSEQQQEELRPELLQIHHDLSDLRSEVEPKVKEILRQRLEEIRTKLTPKQQESLDDYIRQAPQLRRYLVD